MRLRVRQITKNKGRARECKGRGIPLPFSQDGYREGEEMRDGERERDRDIHKQTGKEIDR